MLVVGDTYRNMTTDFAVGRPAADATATAPGSTVSTASIQSVVAGYVNYRISLPSRRISSNSRRPEDEVDGLIPVPDSPPGLDHAVRVLSEEFEQRYEQAS